MSGCWTRQCELQEAPATIAPSRMLARMVDFCATVVLQLDETSIMLRQDPVQL
jgi:hypothetical protein